MRGVGWRICEQARCFIYVVSVVLDGEGGDELGPVYHDLLCCVAWMCLVLVDFIWDGGAKGENDRLAWAFFWQHKGKMYIAMVRYWDIFYYTIPLLP